eukprot:scaffold1483_cov159-Pinguiococcus_pyrenoidosus.AAC.1
MVSRLEIHPTESLAQYIARIVHTMRRAYEVELPEEAKDVRTVNEVLMFLERTYPDYGGLPRRGDDKRWRCMRATRTSVANMGVARSEDGATP